MVSDWNEDILSNIAEVIDSRHKTPVYSDSGYPMVRVVDVNGGALNLESTKRVSDDVYEDFSRGRDPQIGDLIISRVGSYGVVSYVNSNEKFCLGQNTAFIIPKINSRFLYYQLISPFVKWQIEQFVVGAVQKTISLKSIRQFQIKLPPLAEQKAIAHILGSLDDKIELNRQMNETLEAMAQALFKSWFVDFDPVIDNALAVGNAIPDEFNERAAQRKDIEKKDNPDIQSLFPDAFEFTEEMGWIPMGWEVSSIKDHAEKISKGTTPSKAILAKSNDENTVPFLKVRDLDDKGKIDTKNLDLIPESVHENALKRSILRTGDLLFSIAGTIGRVSIIPKELDNSNSNQALAFIRPKDNIKTYFLLQFLKSQEVQNEVKSRVVQAVQANISLAELGSLKFTNAPDELFMKWHLIVQSLIEKVHVLQVENSQLAKLRDTLLPKLMSGELRIPDAVAMVDER